MGARGRGRAFRHGKNRGSQPTAQGTSRTARPPPCIAGLSHCPPEALEAAISEATAGAKLMRKRAPPSPNKQPAPLGDLAAPSATGPGGCVTAACCPLCFTACRPPHTALGQLAAGSSLWGAESLGASGDIPHPCPQLDPCHTSPQPRLAGQPLRGPDGASPRISCPLPARGSAWWPAQLEGRTALQDSQPSARAQPPAGVAWTLWGRWPGLHQTPWCHRSASFSLGGVRSSWYGGAVEQSPGRSPDTVTPLGLCSPREGRMACG